MKILKDFDFKNKRVLVRCNLNVPLNKEGLIYSDFRLKKALPTIEYLIKEKAKVILMGHLGKPFKEIESNNQELKDKKYSLRQVGLRLEELLNQKVKFLDDCIGEKVKKETEKMKAKDIILLENLRFYKEEKEGDLNWAKQLSELGDIFIQDAFAVCHRNHASIIGIPKYLPSGAGFLLKEEIEALSKILKKPEHPLVAIIGGAKIKTKIKLIERFLEKVDHLILGGEIANVILSAKGFSLAKPFLEPEIREKIEKLDLTSQNLHLPVDGIISLKNIEKGLKENYIRKDALGTIKKEEKIYDIGQETIKIFSDIIKSAKMIVWNGPLGMNEEKEFEQGTKQIAENIVGNSSAFKIAGGGSTISTLDKLGLTDKFDHVSTGGGAMLSFLSEEKLPGIEVLE